MSGQLINFLVIQTLISLIASIFFLENIVRKELNLVGVFKLFFKTIGNTLVVILFPQTMIFTIVIMLIFYMIIGIIELLSVEWKDLFKKGGKK